MTLYDYVRERESWVDAWTFERLPYSIEEKEAIYAIRLGLTE